MRMIYACVIAVLVFSLAACKDERPALSIPAPSNINNALPVESQSFSGETKMTIRDSTADFLEEPKAPEGAPNIVIVMADDVGYSDIAPYGGEIQTPNLQALAEGGVRYSHFTVTAMCSPTRAAMLTGMNQHSVGVGWVSEWDFGYPGYRGEMNPDIDTLPEMLQRHGYSTFMVGKWHLTNAHHRSNIGPFTSWPTHNGFDRYWGFLDGEVSQWFPHALVAGTEFIDYPKDGSFYLPDAMSDHAISMLKDLRAYHPERPFLMYYSAGAGHAPHHTKAADREKYKGKYAQGWDVTRQQRLDKQKAMGLLPAATQLSPYNTDVVAWQSLSPEQQKMYARFEENYAGFIDNLDQNVGKLMQYLKDTGQWENTIFIFVSDNGGSREVGVEGDANALRFFHRRPATNEQNLPAFDQIGEASTHPHYPHGWSQTSNTPFAQGKRSVHEGGVRVPMIVSWPKQVKNTGIRHQFHHITDIAPMLLEVIGLDPATEGKQPMQGTSMLYSLNDANAAPRRNSQYYEIEGSRAYTKGNWKIVSYREDEQDYDDVTWQLYNLKDDPSESRDLSAEHPDKIKELEALWLQDAQKYNVLPLIDLPMLQRPMYTQLWKEGGTTERFHYTPGLSTIPRFKAPILPNRSYNIVAKLDRENTGQEGVLVALGDLYSGFTFFIKDNKLHYVNNVAHTVTHLESSTPLPAGEITVEFRFEKINMGLAVASGVLSDGTSFNPLDVLQGNGSLWINGSKVGETRFEYPVFAVWESMDIGQDLITSVAKDAYTAPFRFTGTLHSVDFQLD